MQGEDMESQILIFLDFFKYGNDLWFIDFLSGGLFVSDLTNGNTHLVKELPIESWHENYRSLYIVNGKIYMPPLFATELLIYEMESKKLKKISVKQYVKNEQANFVDIFAYENYLFFIPMMADGIIRINALTDEIDFYDGFSDYLDQSDKMNRPKFRRGCSCNGKIYLATCSGNQIISFNMASCTFDKISIADDKNDGYSLCCCTDMGMVLISYDGKNAVILDKQMRLFHIILSEHEEKFSIILGGNNSVLYIRCSGDEKSELIDIEKRDVRVVNFSTGTGKKKFLVDSFPENNFTFAAKKMDEEIWLYSTKRGSLCVFGFEGNKLREYEFYIEDSDRQKIARMCGERFKRRLIANKEDFVQENKINTLNTFINAIVE